MCKNKTKQVNAARLVEMKRKKDDQRIWPNNVSLSWQIGSTVWEEEEAACIYCNYNPWNIIRTSAQHQGGLYRLADWCTTATPTAVVSETRQEEEEEKKREKTRTLTADQMIS